MQPHRALRTRAAESAQKTREEGARASALGADGAAKEYLVLALPIRLRLSDHEPDRPPIAVELRTGEEPLTLITGKA